MRASVASLSKKFITTFFAATLALGLVPAAAFAESAQDESAINTISAEADDNGRSGEIPNDEGALAIPAGEIINQVQPLQVVAQQEATYSYFLAQTLEDTRTVPMLSANLPISTDEEAVEESIVIGAFEYLGMTFAVEADGATVALVAADYSKLPQEFVEYQVIVIPGVVSPDGIDSYSVTRIADDAFVSFKKDNADRAYTGCEALLSDEDLLAEADVDAAGLSGENPLDGCAGILALGIPASIISIGDEAFAGFETLQYIVVSDDNSEYASFDGALYSVDLTNLRLIPEGRVGTVRVAPSATDVDPEVFSHCPLAQVSVADPDNSFISGFEAGSRISQLLSILECRIHLSPQSYSLFESSMNRYAATNAGDLTINMNSSSLNGITTSTTDGNLKFTVNTNTIRITGWEKVFACSVGELHIHYYSDSGTVVKSYKLSRTGHYFNGWTGSITLAADSTQEKTATIAGTATITANWKGREIALKWDSQGGTPVSNTTQTYSETAKVSLPTQPSRSGYSFKGWFTAASGGTQVTSTTTLPSANATYYAQWTEVNKLTINTGGGTLGNITESTTVGDMTFTVSSNTITVTGWSKVFAYSHGHLHFHYFPSSGGSVVVRTFALTRAGYYFNGWTGSITMAGDSSGQTIESIYGVETITANWKPVLTINMNGGVLNGGTIGDITESTVDGGLTITVSSNTVAVRGQAKVFVYTNGLLDFHYYKSTGGVGTQQYIPKRIGYYFNGWTGLSTTTELYSATITANWIKRQDYSMNFKTNVTGLETILVSAKSDLSYESQSFTAPVVDEVLAMRGYTLLGWSTQDPGTTCYANLSDAPGTKFEPGASLTIKDAYGTASPPTDCTLFAVYKLNEYTVTMDCDGGTFSDVSLNALKSAVGAANVSKNGDKTTLTYTARTNAFALPSPEKSGYGFLGWKEGEGEPGSATIDPAITLANRTLTAVWNASGYSLKLQYKNAAENTVDAMFEEGKAPVFAFNKDQGDDYSVKLNVPYRKGYSFDGWTGAGIVDGPKKDVTVYPNRHIDQVNASNQLVYIANWSPLEYEVSYKMNDGDYIAYFENEAQANPEKYTYDETWTEGSPKPTVELASPKRAGYTFSGWKVTKRENPETVVYDSVYVIDRTCAEDLVYTAIWTPVVSSTLPVTTPVDFFIDAATGATQDVVEGTPKSVTITSSTAVPTELSLVCSAGDDDELKALFDEQQEGAFDALVSSLGFGYDLSKCQYVSSTASKKLAFERLNGTAGPLTIAGSERSGIENPKALSPLTITGPFSLLQKSGSVFEDLSIDLSRVRVRSAEELKAVGVSGKVHLADIVWTVSLPASVS